MRITEAAMHLHATVGPARTTVSAVAEEAGVQRSTVYRHFPTDVDLFGACSQHWLSLNPPPDPTPWDEIADPGERLARALAELYGWYGRAEPMLVNITRDAALVPAMDGPVAAFRGFIDHVRAELMKGRPERGRAGNRVSAAIALALGFGTWHSLAREANLGSDETVALMTAMVEAAGGELAEGEGFEPSSEE